jgi:hypothetical protein
MVFCSKRVQSRLALYHSVRALYMPFSDDAEETFCKALAILQVLISLLLQLCDILIEDLQLFKCILQLQHSLCLGQELKCAGLSDDFSSDRYQMKLPFTFELCCMFFPETSQ